VVRFWNREVFQNLEGVLQTIYDLARQRSEHWKPPPP
jgi:very-short-patch-repair endonuclease